MQTHTGTYAKVVQLFKRTGRRAKVGRAGVPGREVTTLLCLEQEDHGWPTKASTGHEEPSASLDRNEAAE